MMTSIVDRQKSLQSAARILRTRFARSMFWSLMVVASVALLGALFIKGANSNHQDFEAYYSGAVAISEGSPLYGRALVWRDTGYTIDAQDSPPPTPGMPYVYPPFMALMLVPLEGVPFGALTGTWYVLTFSAIFISAYLLVGLLVVGSARRRLVIATVVAALIALFQPTRLAVLWGQVDTILLLLLVLSLVCLVRNRSIQAGIWLGIAIAIKPTLGPLLLFLLWKRAYRGAIVAGTLAAAAVLVPFLFTGGMGTFYDYVSAANYWSSVTFAVSPVNQAPYGLLLRLFTANTYTIPVIASPELMNVLRIVFVVAVLAALVFAIGRDLRKSAAQLSLEFGLAVIGVLLVGPLSEQIHYTYLALPVTALGLVLIQRRASIPTGVIRGTLAAIYVYLCLPGLTPIEFLNNYAWPVAAPTSLLTGVHVYGLLALSALLAAFLFSQKTRNSRSAHLPEMQAGAIDTLDQDFRNSWSYAGGSDQSPAQ